MSGFILILLFLTALPAYLLGKWIFKKEGRALLFAAALLLGLLAASLRPVCVPIETWDTEAGGRIEERQDRDFYLRVFQFRDGRWHHCKTWISRAFFF